MVLHSRAGTVCVPSLLGQAAEASTVPDFRIMLSMGSYRSVSAHRLRAAGQRDPDQTGPIRRSQKYRNLGLESRATVRCVAGLPGLAAETFSVAVLRIMFSTESSLGDDTTM